MGKVYRNRSHNFLHVFQSMLGDRYGYRPPPPEIAADEYEMLLAEAERLHHDQIDIVKTWYRKDDNTVPPMYVLQVILPFSFSMLVFYLLRFDHISKNARRSVFKFATFVCWYTI